jgi:4-amino-4-deoxy-L-arabinose transferase-like glycosyltransferase
MDAPLTCLTVLAVLAYERWRHGNGFAGAALFGICLGSAVLLKGAAGLVPVGIAAADSFVRMLRKERLGRPAALSAAALLLAAGIAIAIASPWFIVMGNRHGAAFGSTLFLHEHLRRVLQPMQGHGGPLWTYIPLIAVSFFPWVVFLPSSALRSEDASDRARSWRLLCIVWILVVLVPFSLIRTKLPGYVTPLFPPMALLVGAGLAQGGTRRSWLALLVGALALGALAGLLPVAAAKLGARVGASGEARLLIAPALVWVAGYLVMAFAAAAVLLRRSRNPIGMLALGQVAAVVALLFGVLPVLSPYLGAGSSGLAELARRELPGNRIVLYQTHPENVNFVLQRPVPVYDQHQRQQLLDQLRTAPTALIAPARDSAFWSSLPVRRTWRLGDRVLLGIPKMEAQEGRR